MTSIAIVEDHLLLVESLEYVLKSESDLAVVGAASTVQSGFALVRRHQPDLLLIEVDLPDGSGFDLLKQLSSISPKTRTIIYARNPDEVKLMQAINQGAHGFLTKNCTLSDLLNGIRKVAAGETVMPQQLLVNLVRNMSHRSSDLISNQKSWEHLTMREMEILNYLAQGKSGDFIALELNITSLTVRTHIRNILAKLGVHSRLEAVSFAMSNGLLEMSM